MTFQATTKIDSATMVTTHKGWKERWNGLTKASSTLISPEYWHYGCYLRIEITGRLATAEENSIKINELGLLNLGNWIHRRPGAVAQSAIPVYMQGHQLELLLISRDQVCVCFDMPLMLV